MEFLRRYSFRFQFLNLDEAMMKKKFVYGMVMAVIAGCNWSNVNGQDLDKAFSKISVQKDKVVLSGILQFDSKIVFDQAAPVMPDESKNLANNKKSVWLAAGLSLVIPGAGEFYTEKYLKSAIFVALEAAAITVGLIYDKKGNDQTISFQNFADQHWSVERYANWTLYHAQSINSSVNPSDYHVINNNGKVNWSELNRLESDLGGYYSHHLPNYGEQQYFELIGKYPQFNVGWDDFGDDVTKAFSYGDPLTPRFVYYSHERGKANDYYNVASKAVIVVMINHFISAIDAAWSAHKYNKGLDMKVSLERYNQGFQTVYYPQLNLKYNF
jgi:hypothetical protein